MVINCVTFPDCDHPLQGAPLFPESSHTGLHLGRPHNNPVRQILVSDFMDEHPEMRRVKVTCSLVGVIQMVSWGDTQTMPHLVTDQPGWGKSSYIVQSPHHTPFWGARRLIWAPWASPMPLPLHWLETKNSPGHWTKSDTSGGPPFDIRHNALLAITQPEQVGPVPASSLLE